MIILIVSCYAEVNSFLSKSNNLMSFSYLQGRQIGTSSYCAKGTSDWNCTHTAVLVLRKQERMRERTQECWVVTSDWWLVAGVC